MDNLDKRLDWLEKRTKRSEPEYRAERDQLRARAKAIIDGVPEDQLPPAPSEEIMRAIFPDSEPPFGVKEFDECVRRLDREV